MLLNSILFLHVYKKQGLLKSSLVRKQQLLLLFLHVYKKHTQEQPSSQTATSIPIPTRLQKSRSTQEQPSLQTATSTPQSTKNKAANDILLQALNLKLNYLNCGMPQKPEDTNFKKIGCSGTEITPNFVKSVWYYILQDAEKGKV
jgi:hypothetical protein